MDTRKIFNNSPLNASAWGWDDHKKGSVRDGISIGLYKKPTKKELAEPAKAVVCLMSKNGNIICRVNMNMLKQFGGKLILEEHGGTIVVEEG